MIFPQWTVYSIVATACIARGGQRPCNWPLEVRTRYTFVCPKCGEAANVFRPTNVNLILILTLEVGCLCTQRAKRALATISTITSKIEAKQMQFIEPHHKCHHLQQIFCKENIQRRETARGIRPMDLMCRLGMREQIHGSRESPRYGAPNPYKRQM